MKVLHVPFQFIAGQLGGTEVYVESLCRHLKLIGIDCAIATPVKEPGVSNQAIDGIPIFEFALDPTQRFEYAHGQPDEVAASNFEKILESWRPDVVHLHAHTSAVSELLVDAAKRIGARVVFTYHTPTVSCARGTMMLMGRTPCDGVLNVSRCTACVLQSHRLTPFMATAVARTPAAVGVLLARLGLHGGFWTALRMRQLVTSAQRRFHRIVGKVDRVVAVCDWVAKVLRNNAVDAAKLVVSRQGLPYTQQCDSIDSNRDFAPHISTDHPPPFLHIRFFGRFDRSKGVDVLVKALAAIPTTPVKIDLFLIRYCSPDQYHDQLRCMIDQDKRITLHAALPAAEVVAAMRACDMVVVPSQWLETGPLVVLEAFAAGTPVIGSRLGGIAELVHDGVDGVLVVAKDISAWSAQLQHLATDRRYIKTLRKGVKSPRLMSAVASEMLALYLDSVPCR